NLVVLSVQQVYVTAKSICRQVPRASSFRCFDVLAAHYQASIATSTPYPKPTISAGNQQSSFVRRGSRAYHAEPKAISVASTATAASAAIHSSMLIPVQNEV